MTHPTVSNEDPDQGTEYGGVSGLVQPPPHEPTPSEDRTILVRENWYGTEGDEERYGIEPRFE